MLDIEALREATALLRGVLEPGPRQWDGAPEEDVVEALQEAAAVSRACDGLKVAVAGALTRRSEPLTASESLARRLGHVGSKKLLAELFGVGLSQAWTWLEIAAAVQPRSGMSVGDLPPLRPAVAQALRAGELSVEVARPIIDHLASLHGESVVGGTDVAEAAMVANATGGRVNLLAHALPAGRDVAGGADPGRGGDVGTAWAGGPAGGPFDGEGAAAGRWGGAPASGPFDDGVPPGRTWFGGSTGEPPDGEGPTADAWAGPWASSPTDPPHDAGAALAPPVPDPRWSLLRAAQPPDSGQGPDTDRTFAGDPRSSGTGWGAVPTQNPSPTGGTGPGSPRSEGLPGTARFAPVIPPSMDDRDAVKSLGSAISGGRLGPDRIREESKAWGLVLDPDGAQPAYEEQRRQRSFRLSKRTSGGYAITGFAPEVEGAAMRTLLDAYLAPRTQDPAPLPFPGAERDMGADGVGDDGGGLGAGAYTAPEERTRDHRAFDALAHILALHAASAQAPTVGGVAPTLLITASLRAIDEHRRDCAEHEPDPGPRGDAAGTHGVGDGRGAGRASGDAGANEIDARTGRPGFGSFDGADRGAGEGQVGAAHIPTDDRGLPDVQALVDRRFARIGRDGTPVPLSAVMHLLCDAAIQVLLTDDAGVPLKLGRAQRLFSKHQRRVLAARDHHCRAPGCDIPAAWCEVHHVLPWRDGGPTDVSNAVMLCSFHHHEIDRGRLRVVHHPDAELAVAHRYTVESTWAPPRSRPRYRPTG